MLHALFAVVLLLGGLGGDWAPGPNEPAAIPHACCCGTAEGMEDTCPCPKPEGNRAPANGGACASRPTVTAPLVAGWRTQTAQRRIEPRPVPTAWLAARNEVSKFSDEARSAHGRDPDLGRHLARLGSLLI